MNMKSVLIGLTLPSNDLVFLTTYLIALASHKLRHLEEPKSVSVLGEAFGIEYVD